MADAPKKPNFFELLAVILSGVRDSLENNGGDGDAANWVKIARVRNYEGKPREILAAAVDTLNEAIHYLIFLTLHGQEWLVIGDGYRAYVDLAADLFETIASEDFQKAITALTKSASSPMGGAASGIKDALAAIREVEDYIPTYRDLLVLGHELYRLFAVVQHGLDEQTTSGDEINLTATGTGKLRVLQWAFSSLVPEGNKVGLKVRKLTNGEPVDVYRLGTRRIPDLDNLKKLPGESRAEVRWSFGQSSQSDEIFFFSYESSNQKDVGELDEILSKLGYSAKERSKNLRQFQAVNNLSINGALDVETLNRLFHLDYLSQNVRRALPFDKDSAKREEVVVTSGRLKLINGNADYPEDGTEVIKDKGYPYYLVGQVASTTSPSTQGWVRQYDPDSAPGFVAVTSRRRQARDSGLSERYDGGLLSIGEASQGSYFFAARQTEPWFAGKSPSPGSQSLGGSKAPMVGSRSWLYQRIPIAGNKQIPTLKEKQELYLVASVQVRCLLKKDLTSPLPIYVQDKARLLLHAYGDAGTLDVRALADARDQDTNRLVFTAPYPDDDLGTLGFEDIRVRRSQHEWENLRTGSLKVPADATGVAVILEGRHGGNFDTDVFFDNLQILWEIRKKP